MFAFASLATGTLWTYWYYHTAPFIPLQQAIAAEFHGSAPRVDGGRRRMHKGTPSQLWIIMRVEFDVENDDATVERTVTRVAELAHEHLQLDEFEQLKIRLFRGEPEKYLHKRDIYIQLGEAADESATTDSSESPSAPADSGTPAR